VAGSWATRLVKINWKDVRRQTPAALVAENAGVPGCSAEARLWHRPIEFKPWVIRVTVDCDGQTPKVWEAAFTHLGTAMTGYLKRRDRATAHLMRELRHN